MTTVLTADDAILKKVVNETKHVFDNLNGETEKVTLIIREEPFRDEDSFKKYLKEVLKSASWASGYNTDTYANKKLLWHATDAWIRRYFELRDESGVTISGTEDKTPKEKVLFDIQNALISIGRANAKAQKITAVKNAQQQIVATKKFISLNEKNADEKVVEGLNEKISQLEKTYTGDEFTGDDIEKVTSDLLGLTKEAIETTGKKAEKLLSDAIKKTEVVISEGASLMADFTIAINKKGKLQTAIAKLTTVKEGKDLTAITEATDDLEKEITALKQTGTMEIKNDQPMQLSVDSNENEPIKIMNRYEIANHILIFMLAGRLVKLSSEAFEYETVKSGVAKYYTGVQADFVKKSKSKDPKSMYSKLQPLITGITFHSLASTVSDRIGEFDAEDTDETTFTLADMYANEQFTALLKNYNNNEAVEKTALQIMDSIKYDTAVLFSLKFGIPRKTIENEISQNYPNILIGMGKWIVENCIK